MPNYAVVDVTGIISNILVADSKEIAEEVSRLNCFEIDESNSYVKIGYVFDEETQLYVDPNAESVTE